MNATRIVEGTWPPGREWATNPIPAFGPDGLSEFPFAPLVPGACGTKGETTTQECPDRVMNWRIIDKLHVPSTLSPGKYVLSMRWDAEGTPQIWAACSDIEITPSVGAPATPSPPAPAPPQAPPRSCGLCSCDACTPTQAYSLWYSDWCGDPYQNGCDGTRPECECSTSASASSVGVATSGGDAAAESTFAIRRWGSRQRPSRLHQRVLQGNGVNKVSQERCPKNCRVFWQVDAPGRRDVHYDSGRTDGHTVVNTRSGRQNKHSYSSGESIRDI